MVLRLVHFLVGSSVSSPAMLPSQAAVWDLLHFPLVAPPVPPRYTFPNSSFDSCLAQTSNMVHASLAVPPLKNLHLRHSQTAAARSRVGPKSWFSHKTCSLGKQDLLEPCQPLFCGHLSGGGSCTGLRVTLWDVDLDHRPGCHFQDHVIHLGVAYLGQ